jgi:hypothetical protein
MMTKCTRHQATHWWYTVYMDWNDDKMHWASSNALMIYMYYFKSGRQNAGNCQNYALILRNQAAVKNYEISFFESQNSFNMTRNMILFTFFINLAFPSDRNNKLNFYNELQ